MAPSRKLDPERSNNGFLDLQTVLRGAGALIVVLAGLTWGLFNSNHTSDVEEQQRTNGKQWERIRELHDQLIRHQEQMDQNRKFIDDQEFRIRALEHRGEPR